MMPGDGEPRRASGRSWPLAVAVAGAVGVSAFLTTAALLGAFRSPVAVAGLTAPRGLTPTEEGGLLVAEAGAGRLLEMGPGGEIDVIRDGLPFTLISGPGGRYPSGPSAVIRRDGAYYYVVGEHIVRGFSELYRLVPGGDPEPLTGQEIVDRFPTNPLTNPYDLVSAPDGGFFISDAGINAVLHVTEEGEISEYVTFPRQENPRPIDGAFAEIDVVPTGLDYGPDGALYVASLTGFPYPEGAARVYRIEVRDVAEGGEAAVFAEGFTAATDLAFDRDGSLLVLEFSTDMQTLAEEHEVREAHRIPGRLVRWRDGEITVVRDGLVSPTSVAVVGGRIFVSEEFAGRVTEIAVDGEPRARAWWLAVAVGVSAAAVAALGARVGQGVG